MMDYSKLSDHEINVQVGAKLSLVDKLMAANAQRDYCNSWADAGPIIEQHRISIISLSGDEWGARVADGWNSERAIHENPLRAAMIVFLMMHEGEE